jgi:hypothetical protein
MNDVLLIIQALNYFIINAHFHVHVLQVDSRVLTTHYS